MWLMCKQFVLHCPTVVVYVLGDLRDCHVMHSVVQSLDIILCFLLERSLPNKWLFYAVVNAQIGAGELEKHI